MSDTAERDRLQAIVDTVVAHRRAFHVYNRVCNRKHTPDEFGVVHANMQRRGIAAQQCLDAEIKREDEAANPGAKP